MNCAAPMASRRGPWQQASEQYRRASDSAGTVGGEGARVRQQAREAVSRGAEEARDYASGDERQHRPDGAALERHGGHWQLVKRSQHVRLGRQLRPVVVKKRSVRL